MTVQGKHVAHGPEIGLGPLMLEENTKAKYSFLAVKNGLFLMQLISHGLWFTSMEP